MYSLVLYTYMLACNMFGAYISCPIDELQQQNLYYITFIEFLMKTNKIVCHL